MMAATKRPVPGRATKKKRSDGAKTSQVFISWSGPRSGRVARVLKERLPDIVQQIEPWMSQTDIQAGARWLTDITLKLATHQMGIVCLTPENVSAPWLLFEAGALSNAVGSKSVVPFIVEMEPGDVKQPLGQFNGVKADREGVLSLVNSLNSALGTDRLSAERLDRAFNNNWPDFAVALSAAAASQAGDGDPEPKRSKTDLIEEILEIVRAIARTQRDDKYGWLGHYAGDLAPQLFNVTGTPYQSSVPGQHLWTVPESGSAVPGVSGSKGITLLDEMLGDYAAARAAEQSPSPDPPQPRGSRKRQSK
jgi:hypothetical protein